MRKPFQARYKMINQIIALDPEPPEGMDRAAYRRWLKSISTDDLGDWLRLIRKCAA